MTKLYLKGSVGHSGYRL